MNKIKKSVTKKLVKKIQKLNKLWFEVIELSKFLLFYRSIKGLWPYSSWFTYCKASCMWFMRRCSHVCIIDTNHLPKYDQGDVVKKICKFVLFLHNKVLDTSIFYSGILQESYITHILAKINLANEILFNLCDTNYPMHLIAHNYFPSKVVVDRTWFWKDLIHTNKNGLRELALWFIRTVRYKNNPQCLGFW